MRTPLRLLLSFTMTSVLIGLAFGIHGWYAQYHGQEAWGWVVGWENFWRSFAISEGVTMVVAGIAWAGEKK